MNRKKLLRNMRARGVSTIIEGIQLFITKMTNWQNSQWLRGGADPNKAWYYCILARPKPGESLILISEYEKEKS